MVVIESGGKRFYMDNHLAKQLEAVKKSLDNDDDYVLAIVGPERAGKSVFGMQCCKAVDPSFSIKDIAFNAPAFEKIVTTAKKRKAVLYDEAFSGLSSRSSLSGVNKQLVTLMQEMGQRNLFVVIILPSFFLLDWYAACHRSRALGMVYRRKGKRGFWRMYNKKKKDAIYEIPRHLRSKRMPKPSFRGRFLNQYTVDEKAYRKFKAEAFKNRETPKEAKTRYQEQRDDLIRFLKKRDGLSLTKLTELLKEAGVKLGRSALGKITKE